MSRPVHLASALAIFLLAIVLAGCGAQASEIPPPAPLPPGGVRLTLLREQNVIASFVPVTVSGRRYLFLLDSGALRTVLRQGLSLGSSVKLLPGSQGGEAVGCGFTYRDATVRDWSLGGHRLASQTVAVQALDGVPPSFDGYRVGGVIGADVLASFGRVTLDLARQTLTLGGDAPLVHPLKVTVLGNRSGARALIVPLQVHGRSVHFDLDTGASVTTVTSAFAKGLTSVGPSTVVQGASGCGERVREVRLDHWSAGRVTLPTTLALAGTLPDSIGRFHFSGLLGADVLYDFQEVVLDYRGAKISLVGSAG